MHLSSKSRIESARELKSVTSFLRINALIQSRMLHPPFPLTTTIYWQWSTYSYIVHTEITPGFLATSEASLCLSQPLSSALTAELTET